jgi:hypothetical protein
LPPSVAGGEIEMANIIGSDNIDVLKGTADEDTMSGLAGNDRSFTAKTAMMN